MNREEKKALNASVLRVTSEDPKWLGYWLNRYQCSEATTPDDVAARLGIGVPGLALLSLCKSPRPGNFSDDLRVACERTGAKVEVLAAILRQEQALSSWHNPGAVKTSGWLLAASDADDGDVDERSVEDPGNGDGA